MKEIILSMTSIIVSLLALTVSIFQIFLQYRRKCLVSFQKCLLCDMHIGNYKEVYITSIVNASREIVNITSMVLYNNKTNNKHIIKYVESFPQKLPIGLQRGESYSGAITQEDIESILKDQNCSLEDLEVQFKDSLGKLYKAKYKK